MSASAKVQSDSSHDLSGTSLKDSQMIANALGSATAGIVSRLLTHPLDTAKARLQAPPLQSRNLSSTNKNTNTRLPYKGPIDVLVRTSRTEGIRGLYRGFGAVIIGGTPGTVCYLCTYEIAKERLSRKIDSNSHEFLAHFTAGMIAETVACIIYVPVDVIKERLQVQHSPSRSEHGVKSKHIYYKNSFDAMVQISKNEGLRGIYKGYAATLGSFGPFSALYFTFYEQLKYWSRLYVNQTLNDSQQSETSARSLEKEIELPFYLVVLCSCGAGALASWLTSPLDMAKLRLQVQRGTRYTGKSMKNSNGVAYRGMIDCLQIAYREGGARALFRGAGARVIHFAPATTITMTLYETCRSFFSKSLNTDEII